MSVPSPFNSCSMTKASAMYEHDLMFRSPSDRIASYFSPKALNLTKSVLKDKLGGSAFSSPAPKAPTSPSKSGHTGVHGYHSPAKPGIEGHGHGAGASRPYMDHTMEDDLEDGDERSMAFSRQRALALRRTDEIRVYSEEEVDSHMVCAKHACCRYIQSSRTLRIE
jgi:hypothetical protein